MRKIFMVPLFLLILFSCTKKDTGVITSFYNYPNPFNSFTEGTTYKVSFKTANIAEYNWRLDIYTENGNPVYSTSNTVTVIASPLLIVWNGKDNLGHTVRNGVYTAILTLDVTKDLSNYIGGSNRASCYTVIY